MSIKMNLSKMFNNSNASHLHFLATLEVLFLLLMMYNKDSMTEIVMSKVILHSNM